MKLVFVHDVVDSWEASGAGERLQRLSDRHNVHWYGPAIVGKGDAILYGVMGIGRRVYGGRSVTEALKFAAKPGLELAEISHGRIDCQEVSYVPCLPIKLPGFGNRTTLAVTWHEVWGDYWFKYLGEVLRWVKAVGVVVLSSRRKESSIIIPEASEAGTPVVTLLHPWNAAPELVTDEMRVICDGPPERLETSIHGLQDTDRPEGYVGVNGGNDRPGIVDQITTEVV